MHPDLTRPGRDGGFTLLELIIVMAIGSLAVAAALVYRGQQQPSLRLIAVQLATDLGAARQSAITSDHAVHVVIMAGGTGYRVSDRPSVALPSAVRLSYQSSPGFNRDADSGPLAFFGDGSSTGGVVRLSDGSGTVALRIGLLTGAVAVERAR